MSDRPQFLFITCQVGAERTVKDELARRWADFQPAFSRPGFLTFKLPGDCTLPPDFDLGAIFARAHGFSLGSARGGDPDRLARGCLGPFRPSALATHPRVGAGRGEAGRAWF